MIAKVVLDVALDRAFDYAVPAALETSVRFGVRVRVPFRNRMACGWVMGLAETSSLKTLKSVYGLAADVPALAPDIVRLARWMASYYIAPIETALKTIMPTAVRREGGSPGRERLVVHIVPPEKRPRPAPTLTARQAEILERIERGGDGFMRGICQQWGVTPGVLRKLEAAGVISIASESQRRDPLRNRVLEPTSPLPLSPAQRAALDVILGAARDPAPKPVLLFGVTASGKTEVYLQAIAAMLEQGRGAIVLVPEIALTPQTIHRFAARFGACVAVLHSQLSDGERHDEWHRIQSGEARVVVGPRSAVFAPVQNLGMIIVDEEHEPSYKQEEAPRYNARDVAVMRGHFRGCAVVLGSATPSLETWTNAQSGKYLMARMRERVPGASPPDTCIVDMRSDGRRDGIPQVFSNTLVEAIRARLACGEQTMLLLNRRGYAPSIVCPACGHVERCENCALPMTYHLRDNVLRCHLCHAFRAAPRVCPKCQSDAIRQQGVGTQRAEAIARQLFPDAAIERMDADVTARKFSHEEILARFRAGRTDILIGTQMIAKGLDFPNVTLVGILNADAGLFVPDFRASERTFQLIAQMSGRSGRGESPGVVLVQTSNPDHPAIQYARTEDYEAFAEGELAEREEADYPPFSRIVCATARSESDGDALRAVALLARAMGDGDGLFDAFPPGPAPIGRIQSQYRYQWIARTRHILPFLSRLRTALAAVKLPASTRLAVDVDALSMM